MLSISKTKIPRTKVIDPSDPKEILHMDKIAILILYIFVQWMLNINVALHWPYGFWYIWLNTLIIIQ